MKASLSPAEAACVKRLAEYFKNGKTTVRYTGKITQEEIAKDCADLAIPIESRDAVLSMMEHLGAISNVHHAAGLRFFHFVIGARAVEIARAVEAAEEEAAKEKPRDIVAEIQDKAKSTPFLAWAIIGSIVLAAALTIINSAIQIAQNLGWMTKPGP